MILYTLAENNSLILHYTGQILAFRKKKKKEVRLIW